MIGIVIAVLSAPLIVFNIIVIAEIAAGCLPFRRFTSRTGAPPAVAILMPAHNEKLCIAATVRATLECAPDVRLIVIADNCTDETAREARSAGAEVIVRNDLAAVGKGHALAFGRGHLADSPPDYVVLLDADTHPLPGAIAELVNASAHFDAAVQASYWMEADAGASPRARISAAAFYLTNVIRLPGLDRNIGASVLTGSGIAVPWLTFSRLPLATGHLAEDLMLGIWLLEQGMPPRSAAGARVVGRTSSDAGTRTQRDRWENGRRQVVADVALRLLRRSIRLGSAPSGWIALRLIIPPLSMLAALNVAFVALAAAVAVLSDDARMPWAHPVSFALLIVAIPLSLVIHGRKDFAAALGNAIPYSLWKFGRAIARRSTPAGGWQRTDRG